MESNREEIQQLRVKLMELYEKQKSLIGNVRELNAEIEKLKETLDKIQASGAKEVAVPKVEVKPAPVIAEKVAAMREVESVSDKIGAPTVVETPSTPQPKPQTTQKSTEESSVESFLGENLASKIGIAVILIGIGVGVKYAIDKNLLGPLMRISLGYLAGAILIGFGLVSKRKYENLSAIMFAGGMAALYFVTFMAYDFYGLLPKLVAFGLMVAFTVITSVAAIRYDKQIIAIVGLVGAYSVPFLLSDGTGKTLHLLIYMAIITIGILYLSFRKAWDSLYLVAFCCTWLIFIVLWLDGMFNHNRWDAPSLLVFLCVFYALFYAALVANKLHHKSAISGGDITINSINSFLAFIFGAALVDDLWNSWYINGVFALLFAASHVVVAFIVKMKQDVDHHLYYLGIGFALMFATASVPMFFGEQGVTVVWSIEAALFFWLGRRKQLAFYEKICYIPLGLTMISMCIVWDDYRWEDSQIILNSFFFTGLVFSASFFFMARLNYVDKKNDILSKLDPVCAALAELTMYGGVIALYITIGAEINNYWQFKDYSGLNNTQFSAWIFIFSMVYVGILLLVNRYFVKDRGLAIVLGSASLAVLTFFLLAGLTNLAWIGRSTLDSSYAELEDKPTFILSLRYISYIALAFMLYATWMAQRAMATTRKFRRGMEIVLHLSFVWICCAELIHIKQMNGGGDLYRAGLTIFGGSYAFLLIGYGIWKKKPHLRMLALVLFGVTLIKLFTFDLSRVDSGSKTIAFISLGVLLLVISFLYTKYKHFILADDE